VDVNGVELAAKVNYLYTRAISLSTYGGARVAAAVFRNWGKTAYGNNGPSVPAIPHERKPRKRGACAEVVALANYLADIDDDWDATTVVVARAKKTKRGGTFVPGLARPCGHCQATLRLFGVQEMVYTTGVLGVDGNPEFEKESL
jgi:cytidine deaminase